MSIELSLTPKQTRFVQEYLVDLNATQAAIRAAYSKKTARQMGEENLSKPDIQRLIRQSMNTRAERTQVSADYVIKTIVETIERCREAAPVFDRQGRQVMVQTQDGKEAAAFEFDSKSVLKGCELLGKHLGLFTDRHELTGKNGGPIEHRAGVALAPDEAYMRLMRGK